jgi:hypothetical protein
MESLFYHQRSFRFVDVTDAKRSHGGLFKEDAEFKRYDVADTHESILDIDPKRVLPYMGDMSKQDIVGRDRVYPAIPIEHWLHVGRRPCMLALVDH